MLPQFLYYINKIIIRTCIKSTDFTYIQLEHRVSLRRYNTVTSYNWKRAKKSIQQQKKHQRTCKSWKMKKLTRKSRNKNPVRSGKRSFTLSSLLQRFFFFFFFYKQQFPNVIRSYNPTGKETHSFFGEWEKETHSRCDLSQERNCMIILVPPLISPSLKNFNVLFKIGNGKASFSLSL